MSVESDIVLLLKGPHSGSSPEFGSSVYPDYAPQTAGDVFAVYELGNSDHDADWSGANAYAIHECTVTVYADEHEVAVSDGAYIVSALHGFSGGSFGAVSLSNIIQLIQVIAAGSGYDDLTGKFFREFDLIITI